MWQRVVLSRKGFDSGAGGHPSPVLPDGTMVSLPIPDKLDREYLYSDLKLSDGETYLNLMKRHAIERAKDGEWQSVAGCHVHADPMLDWRIVGGDPRSPGVFGQRDAAAKHLEQQGVGPGDLFLFFGWFNVPGSNGDRLVLREKGSFHTFFGYLEVAQVLRGDEIRSVAADQEWLGKHPHCLPGRLDAPSNTLYVAAEHLSADPSLPGWGAFRWDEALLLTKPGHTRSHWQLPDFFRDTEISYHSPESWKDGYFQSAGRGQEFVVQANDDVREWASAVIRVGMAERARDVTGPSR